LEERISQLSVLTLFSEMPKASMGTFNTERKYFKDVFMTLFHELQSSYGTVGSKEGFTAMSAARDCPGCVVGASRGWAGGPCSHLALSSSSAPGSCAYETLQGWEIQPHLGFVSPSWELVSKLGLRWFKSRATENFIKDRCIPLS